MKKVWKNIVSVALVVCTLLSTCLFAYANEGLTKEIPGYLQSSSDITTFDFAYPDYCWDFSTKGTYTVKGSASITRLYTLYYFTGADSLRIRISNDGDKEFTAKVYKMGWIDILVSSEKIGVNERVTWNVNTSTTGKYYLVFTEPCVVSGEISNGG